MLSPESDSFYKQNMYANFGDLGVAVKQLVDEYQDKSKGNTNIQTIGITASALTLHYQTHL